MPILGVIADDFTGATDVASMLVRGGMRTVQLIGVPAAGGDAEAAAAAADADAVVVALKSRTTPAHEAVAESLAAWRWLRAAGATRCYFKYCSTFDSTSAGNIGPVAEALMHELGTDFTIACPAFPENGRTIFRGHLFVGDQLLSDSGMRDHPLTPMRDASLVRVLQAQCSVGARVGLLRYDTVAQGAGAVRQRIAALRAEGVRIAVADALHDQDLRTLADGCSDLPLLTAGSGLALGLPELYERLGEARRRADAAAFEPMRGPAVVLSGSCSVATNAQVAHWRESGRPARALDVPALLRGGAAAAAEEAAVREWARQVIESGAGAVAGHAAEGAQAAGAAGAAAAAVPLIYSTAEPSALAATQSGLGALESGARVERAMASIAKALASSGVRRWVVAGGETSGAVVQALGVRALRIGASICPGVPWTQARAPGAPGPSWLALKSGNFGAPDFFSAALRMP